MNTKFSKTTSSSAQIVGSIDDLLIEIFLRLPLKPLVRFKLVSSHWNLVISDPKFCFLRDQEPKPAAGLILGCTNHPLTASKPTCAYVVYFGKSTSPPVRTLKFITNPWSFHCTITTLNYCNGLLLCRSNNTRQPYTIYMTYYVCNPTTNKYFMLPEIRPTYRMCLAFDPSKSPHYKVVCVSGSVMGESYAFVVYSSETGCWRKCGVPFAKAIGVNFECGVYWNGAIHWIAYNKAGKSLYFNPDVDQMPRVMPTPPIECGEYYYFGESCGHLHYINDRTMVKEFSVYEMRRDYSEWFVMYRVDLSCFASRFSCICAPVRGMRDEDSFLVFRIEGKLLRYNLDYKTHETICELDDPRIELCFSPQRLNPPLQPYVESLCAV